MLSKSLTVAMRISISGDCGLRSNRLVLAVKLDLTTRADCNELLRYDTV